jgi:predicted component of type VI protein secretion system
MGARVQIERDATLVAVVDLERERTLFGRAPHCDVQFDDSTVSNDHLEVTSHGSALVATDLGSRNGTLLNGKRLTRPERLADGDTLTVGRCRLRFTIARDAAIQSTELTGTDSIALSDEEHAVAAALVSRFRAPGALAARPASRSEIASATHLAERTVTRRLESLAIKLRLPVHEPRERSHLLAQRVLELGLDRQRR